MRQIYYTIRTLLRERGSNIIRIISLSLGLTIGILLFSQIAFELSYEQCYPEQNAWHLYVVKELILVRVKRLVMIKRPVYDYTVFDVLASTLAEEMPKEVEVASSVLSIWSANIYYEDKLLPDCRYIFARLVSFRLRHTGVGRQSQRYDLCPEAFLFRSILPVRRSEMKTLSGKCFHAEKQNTTDHTWNLQRCTGKYDAHP